MRRSDILIEGFDNIERLCQYLYMSEDHKINVKNSIGVPLEIRMDENMRFKIKNLNFPDCPEFCDDLTFETLLGIVDKLKEQDAVEFPNRFNNRWQEIEEMTAMNLSLNLPK